MIRTRPRRTAAVAGLLGVTALVAVAPPHPVSAAVAPVIHLTFDGDLNDDAALASAVAPVAGAVGNDCSEQRQSCLTSLTYGDDVAGSFMEFQAAEDRNGGFDLDLPPSVSLGDTYTIAMTFSLADVNRAYQRLFNTSSTDNGLYVAEGKLINYPSEVAALTMTNDTVYTIALTRRLVQGSPVVCLLRVVGSTGSALPVGDESCLSNPVGSEVSRQVAGTTSIGVFVDDGPDVVPAAKIYDLRIWDQPLSAAQLGATYGKPGRPASVTVEPGNGRATVRWEPAAGNYLPGSYRATAYRSDRAVRSCTGSGTSCTITGLTNGVEYTVKVAAGNINGRSGEKAAATTVTPRSEPGRATGVKIVGGARSLDVSWAAAPDNGAPITVYRAIAYSAAESGKARGECTTTGQRRCTIRDLARGTTYWVSVTARNVAGTGPETVRKSGTTAG